MKGIGLGIILMLSGLVGAVELAASGSCECQHQCIQDKRENSTYIASVMVKNEITSPYQGASAYRVIVTKIFPNTIQNVKRTILLTDDKCPANLQPKTKYLLAGSVVNDIPCSDPIMWITNCDVVVPWKDVSKKQYKLLESGMAFKYCEESPCNTGEICSRTDTEQCYTCQCPAGYDGCNCEHDIDECQTRPCENGGNCTDGVNTYTCSCVDGFDGDNCENNIDDCRNNPCQNGGNCTDRLNSYTCSCVDGFDGDNCENNIDDCKSNPCQNAGNCTDGVNTYTCSCVDGFDGDNCENNIDDCRNNPCQNGGNCTDRLNSYTCSCVDGFDGDNCENNIDDCKSNPCQNAGNCTDGVNTYTCSCVDGFDGDKCEYNIDDCHNNPCKNGGICKDRVNSYTCRCMDGFDGDNCENNIDNCQTNPCQNAGSCTDGVNTYTCNCVDGFDGDNCENNIVACKSNPCQNARNCTDGVNSYTCSCVDGFDGDNCKNINCDFDISVCGWRQDRQDNFDWTRHRGTTPTAGTGPDRDHTTGSGNYMYMEASNRREGDRANLISPTIHPSNSQYACLTFWYHMNGKGMGELKVIAEHQVNGSLNRNTLWHQKGNHGNVWLYANATLSHPGPLTVTFQAVRGRNFFADIAIDDIRVLPYHCMSRFTLI